MNLMNEINESSKIYTFQAFLEDVNGLELIDKNDDAILDMIIEEIENLQEVRNGDFNAHMDMARQAGYDVRQHAPEPTRRFTPPRNAGKDAAPEQQNKQLPKQNDVVRFNNEFHTVRGITPDGAALLLQSPDGKKHRKDASGLKGPFETKNGKQFWMLKLGQANFGV